MVALRLFSLAAQSIHGLNKLRIGMFLLSFVKLGLDATCPVLSLWLELVVTGLSALESEASKADLQFVCLG